MHTFLTYTFFTQGSMHKAHMKHT